MEYKVVTDTDLARLVHTINSDLQDGWRTIGGIAVSPPPEGTGILLFYQAMIKPAESEFLFGRGEDTE